MQKNQISGIKPFNDFYFKSCYYHQLIAGVACFGIDKDAILLNAFTQIQENFHTREGGFLSEKKLEKLLGYKTNPCNINKGKLIKCIDRGQPIIMGVDCYYLEKRLDTYQIRHSPHFILVYGYDLENETLNVVDHQYQNSDEYKEQVMSLGNLLIANKMFRKGVLNRKLSCYILKQRKQIHPFDIWGYMDEEIIRNNQENSLKNLNELRRLVVYDVTSLCESVEKISIYLKGLKNFYYMLSMTKCFLQNQVEKANIRALISGYSNILSLFWKVKAKNNYDYITKKLENVLRKLKEIETLENNVYDYLLEARKNR